ncbi:MAG: dynein regulation protein LC7 [Chitinivibrionales bacterium]|nr:dynein regulation protein LC7 [Chitinivibrionales bacterium]MBD3356069.1 dynein regulation protein LC7 [Chitinivibrionales bacterium]
MARTLKDALVEFVSIDGVKTAAILGRDGFVIESAGSLELDTDALGAAVAGVLEASEALGRSLPTGNLERHILEFADGTVIIATARDDVLVLIVEANAVVGGVRYAVKKNVDHLAELL